MINRLIEKKRSYRKSENVCRQFGRILEERYTHTPSNNLISSRLFVSLFGKAIKFTMTLSTAERLQFLNWCLSFQGTWIHPSITFKSSEIEGTGVFLDTNKLTEDELHSEQEEPVVVVRIPKSLSLSIDTIAQTLLTRQLQFEVEHENEKSQGQVLISFLSNLRSSFEDQIDPYVRGGLNETNILVGEIQTLMVLKEIRDKSMLDSTVTTDATSPFAEFDPYLDLLLKIDVNAVKTNDLYEDYKKLFKFNEREFRYEIEKLRNRAVKEAITAAFPDWNFDLLISEKWLRQVEMAVISRILEIPEPLKKDEEATEEQETGFAVASTLVPIIDFVNHSNDLVNAYFDADKENGDILLKLDPSKIIKQQDNHKSQELELFIQYSDYEDTLRFLHSYAFIPKSTTITPLYELPIDREYLQNTKVSPTYDLALFLKWFQIKPNVQFVITYDSSRKIDQLRINLDDNFIVFGFIGGLTYQKEIALDIVESALAEYGSFSNSFIQRYLQLEESIDNDAIVDYPVTPFVNEEGEVYENIEDLITNTEDDVIEQLMVDFIEFLNEYASFRLNQLQEFLESHKDSNESSIVIQFIHFEKELLTKFKEICSKIEIKQDLIIGSEECDDEWLKLRLTPRAVNNAIRQQIFEQEQHAALQDQNVDQQNDEVLRNGLDNLSLD